MRSWSTIQVFRIAKVLTEKRKIITRHVAKYILWHHYVACINLMYDIGCKLICLLTIICPAACEEGPGLCANLLTMASVLLILVTFPLSLLFTVKVVQEYERAVIFRLGRLLSGGASGPGVFFVIPCMDIYVKIDMRTATYEIPPQEILTKDSVTVFVNAIMYYKVKPT